MVDGNVLWNGERLEQTEIALVFFARQTRGAVPESFPILGAASSAATAVVLLPPDFGHFLRQHEDATIVCYDAAVLHWLLDAHFRRQNDTEALATLWAYSKNSRLIDLMLLDQHVRRYRGEDGTEARPRHQLLHRLAGVELPEDLEIQQRVTAAWARASQNTNDPVLDLVATVAVGIFKAYQPLMADVCAIEQAVEADQLPAVIEPPPDNAEEMAAKIQRSIDMLLACCPTSSESSKMSEITDGTSIERRTTSMPRKFGPLGVGIDVQGAIAVGQPNRPSLQFDRQQLGDLRNQNDCRYQRASERLHADAGARPCFQWCDGRGGKRLIARGDDGLPIHHSTALKVWLRGFRDKLCDIHNLPAAIPVTQRGDPSFDSEQWGIWAACDRSLRAWRDIERSARLDCALLNGAIVQPTYNVVPVLSARNPDLIALRALGVPAFRPQMGHVFLVGTLPLLKVCCFAAVHQGTHRVPQGRLAGFFLATENPIGQIAAELYAIATGEIASRAPMDVAEAKGSWSTSPLEDATDRFAALEVSDPDTYWRWIGVTAALLETIPLGLPGELVQVLLQEEHNWRDASGVEIADLVTILVGQVIPELHEFLSGDVQDRLARILGLSPHRAAVLLTEREHSETTAAALRNDLLQRREGSPVWKFIRRVREEQTGAGLPNDDEIVERVLKYPDCTEAGRIISPAFSAGVRHQQLLLLADEVMKAVAFALVADGFPLAAVSDNGFVLEVGEADVGQDLLERVTRLAVDAGRRILGRFASPCRCEQMARW